MGWEWSGVLSNQGPLGCGGSPCVGVGGSLKMPDNTESLEKEKGRYSFVHGLMDWLDKACVMVSKELKEFSFHGKALSKASLFECIPFLREDTC